MAASSAAPTFVFGANTESRPRGPPADAGNDTGSDMSKLDELLATLNLKEGAGGGCFEN